MFEILRNKGAIYNEADDVLGKIARDIETDDKEVEMYELDDEIGGEGEDDLDLDDSELDEIDIHDVEDMSEFDIDAEEAHLDTDYINLEDFNTFNLESMMMELEEIEARLESNGLDSLDLVMFAEDVDLDFLFEGNVINDLEELHLEALVFELEDFEIDVDRGTEVITEFEDDDDDELLDDDDDDFLDL